MAVNYKTLIVGPIATNCYIVYDNSRDSAVVIDPGAEAERIIAALEENKLKLKAIINTHGHGDHIKENKTLKQKYNCPIYIHKDDSDFLDNPDLNGSILIGNPFTSPKADHFLKDGEVLDIDGMRFSVFHTPGHTPGGVCLKIDGLLFTGDTLFCGTVGRCDLPGGDGEKLKKSLKIFDSFPGETIILPGHENKCVLSIDRNHNPFLKADFNQ